MVFKQPLYESSFLIASTSGCDSSPKLEEFEKEPRQEPAPKIKLLFPPRPPKVPGERARRSRDTGVGTPQRGERETDGHLGAHLYRPKVFTGEAREGKNPDWESEDP